MAILDLIPDEVLDALKSNGFNVFLGYKTYDEHNPSPTPIYVFELASDTKASQFVRHNVAFSGYEQVGSPQAWAAQAARLAADYDPWARAAPWLDDSFRPESRPATDRWGSSGADLVNEFSHEADALNGLAASLAKAAAEEAQPSPIEASAQQARGREASSLLTAEFSNALLQDADLLDTRMR